MPTLDVTKQLDALVSQIGFVEGPNNQNPYGPWQGVHNAAWCDSFAQWGAVENGGFRWQKTCQFGVKGDAYCPYTRVHAVELGLWRGPQETPKPGWQALFDWAHNGVADHIGTVVEPRGAQFVTVEGNYRSAVMYVLRDRKYLLGFVALPSGPPASKPGGTAMPSNIVRVATREVGGTWKLGADGGVFAQGGAPFLGGMGGKHLNAPMVAIIPTADEAGYWLVGADGGVFAFGNARPLNPYAPLMQEYATGARSIVDAVATTNGLLLLSNLGETYAIA